MMKHYFITLSVVLMGFTATAQRIAVLSDIHVSPDNENSRKLVEAVNEINRGGYDAVVVNGDLTNEGSNRELTFVKSILDDIQAPLYLIPGNHENNWSQSATKTFFDLWGNDRFSALIDNTAIVGINCGPYMKMGDGHVKQEDLHWLQQTLDQYKAEGRRIVSFNHYPIRKDDLDNYQEYSNLINPYPVMIHINGHYHKWNTYKVGDIDAVMIRALSVYDNFGYTVLDIGDDKITVYEKVLDRDPEVKYEFDINLNHVPSAVELSYDYTQPVGFEVTRVYADSASVFTRLAFDADRVYFGNSLGFAKAVDKASGDLVWSVPTGASIFSRPVTLTSDNLAIPHASGITVVDRTNGGLVAYYPSVDGPYVADGILSGDSLYFQGGYCRMECRDPEYGSIVWRYDSINNYCQASPVVDGDDLIFGAWDTYLRCLDTRTGELKWQWSNGKPGNLLSPGNVVPVLTEDRVYIVAPDRFMTAIDRKTGETIWRDKSHRYRESLGHSADGAVIYAKTMDGELVAIDAMAPEFTELWLCDMGLGYEHAPCIVAETDEVIYVGSRRGIVTAVSPTTHDVLWQLTLGSSEINGIDIDETDGAVWVSLIEGSIYRIKKQ